MKKRYLGYAVWLLMAACLYFFENNTGTRVVLALSLTAPLVPALRRAFFGPDEARMARALKNHAVKSPTPADAKQPGDIRKYIPGDPVQRIHWKLSAKKDDLLIREYSRDWDCEPNEARSPAPAADEGGAHADVRGRIRALRFALMGTVLVCAALMLTVPDANAGARVLCNRLFAMSEALNSYAYEYFPVPEGQSVLLAGALAALAAISLAALIAVSRSRAVPLCAALALAGVQAYFGLSLPAWANVALYVLLAVKLMKRPLERNSLAACGAAAVLAALLVALILPGVHALTESASETVRDNLSLMAQQVAGAISEAPAGDTETRHVFTQSLYTGDEESRTGREYRLVNIEQEQISMPHWVNYLKIALLLLLACALIVLPFAPFMLINARRKRARAARSAFQSEDVNAAVCAIFGEVIAWMDITGCGAGNALYRSWAESLPQGMPDGYAARFSECAADFEAAAYGRDMLPEESRARALELLGQTRDALYGMTDWRTRLRLKYWICMCE